MPDTPDRLRSRLDGLLFFPVTAFTPDGSLDTTAFRTHVRARLDAGAGAVFAACGTGEYHALDLDEYEAVVAAAVAETAGAVPVVAGVGHGTALALEFLRRAERAGADGVLALPPYLVKPSQQGLLRHYTDLARATDLGVIVYARDNAVLEPDTVAALAALDNVIGLKDGIGDLDLLQRVISAVRTTHPGLDFRYFNGLPTAELTGLAYRGLGVTLYSSAVFCFAPDLALAFHKAVNGGDDASANRLLDGFFRPLVELRNQGRGYAVSLVKAGVRLDGLDVGTVRAPLAEPDPEHVAALAELVTRARALL
ncbi:5-dehydro-4-deoxyglucarate dehydratase [Kitasatospora phosalacinea]|uniref:Probable 5-dehydro-4-deoxyglucarate dehydratase n=1 Tax=Kitasatospora phosalacinea TaxID=2065 RepID=A0A9W6PH12_9ACTN|nr:5-dehydro-4-deoxyglucarate dehydratase [Kitasatospora phosalacinea]GLW54773.1 putative 5-dehydro-4-deoxyglucarate dehydratase 1 [Kitasatospora phosalacinea]